MAAARARLAIARLIPAARMMCVFASEIVIQWPAVGIPQP
jgi:hypothetical protein